jgi:hypothetical protein
MVEEYVKKETSVLVLSATCFHAGFLLGLFSDHEDGNDIFFRNVG